jgi:tetraacyldisaccharide-1-P 4'-kinase
VVILEDGHQTGRVGRHVDVLILDAWCERDGVVAPLAGPVVPFGPYRETGRGAARAGIWLLEDPAPPPGPPGVAVTGFVRHPVLPAGISDRQRIAVVSGLGRPLGFETAARGLVGEQVVLAVRCRDHARYDARLVGRLLAEGSRRRVDCWLTTAKDMVKLAAVWPSDPPLLTLESAVAWTGRETLPDLVEERLAALGAVGREA